MMWCMVYNTVHLCPLYCLISLTICLTVHSQHIVHGDLSGVHILVVIPGSLLIRQNEQSNVLVGGDGKACITDFGLSTLLTQLGG